MEEKLLNALKTEYKNLGLSDKDFDGVAKFYSKTITNESEIESVVKQAEPALKAIQSAVDRMRTDSQLTKRELEAKIKELEDSRKPDPKPNPDGGAKEKDPEITALESKLNGILEKQSKADKAQQDSALKSQARALMIKDGVDKSKCDDMLSIINIDEGETAETLSQKGVDKFNYFKTQFTPQAGNPPASQGEGGKSTLKEYFESKAKKAEEAQKLREDVETK